MPSAGLETCIVSDIGGTNSRVFLVQLGKEGVPQKTLVSRQYLSNDFPSLEELMARFLAEEECRTSPPKYCVLSIAGSPQNNRIARLANINWSEISGDAISSRFALQHTKLLNDFEVIGYSAISMDLELMTCLHPSRRPLNRQRMVVAGAGTGLGVVFLRSVEGRYLVVPSEGGHLYQGPTDELEHEFQRFVFGRFAQIAPSKRFKYADSEHLFCGLGLPFLYEFFYERVHGRSVERKLTGREVVDSFNRDEVGRLAREMYMRVLARVIHQVSKVFLCEGGVLVLGGIIHYVFETVFQSNVTNFWVALGPFVHSDPSFKAAFDRVSVYLCAQPITDFAIEGCLNYVVTNLKAPVPKVPADDIYSPKLNERVCTLGCLVAERRGTPLFCLGKVVQALGRLLFQTNEGRKFFEAYEVIFLDRKGVVLLQLDQPHIFPKDVVCLRGTETVYAAAENAVYVLVQAVPFINVCSRTFDALRDEFGKKHSPIAEVAERYCLTPRGPAFQIAKALGKGFVRCHDGRFFSLPIIARLERVIGEVFLRKNPACGRQFTRVEMASCLGGFEAICGSNFVLNDDVIVVELEFERWFEPGFDLQMRAVLTERNVLDRGLSADVFSRAATDNLSAFLKNEFCTP